MLARVQIEQEIDQRALQPRAGTGETNEPAPAQFRCSFKIEQLQLRSQRDVIQTFPSNFGLSPNPHYGISARVLPNRRIAVRQIRNLQNRFLASPSLAPIS